MTTHLVQFKVGLAQEKSDFTAQCLPLRTDIGKVWQGDDVSHPSAVRVTVGVSDHSQPLDLSPPASINYVTSMQVDGEMDLEPEYGVNHPQYLRVSGRELVPPAGQHTAHISV